MKDSNTSNNNNTNNNCSANTWNADNNDYSSNQNISTGFKKSTHNNIDEYYCEEEDDNGNNISINVKYLPPYQSSGISYSTSSINEIKVEINNDTYKAINGSNVNIDDKLFISYENNDYIVYLQPITVYDGNDSISLKTCALKVKKSF